MSQLSLEKTAYPSLIRRINGFLESPWFVLLICVATGLSSMLGLELFLYTGFILIGLYVALLGNDFLPITILVACSYISPAIAKNPGQSENSVFYPQNGGIYLAVLFLLFLISVIYRLIRDRGIRCLPCSSLYLYLLCTGCFPVLSDGIGYARSIWAG